MMIEPDLHPPDDLPEEERDPDWADDLPDPPEPSDADYDRGAWLAEARLRDRIFGKD